MWGAKNGFQAGSDFGAEPPVGEEPTVVQVTGSSWDTTFGGTGAGGGAGAGAGAGGSRRRPPPAPPRRRKQRR